MGSSSVVLIYNYLIVVILFSSSPFESQVSLGVLPSESRPLCGVVSEVTKSGGLLVDGSSKVELLDDVSRSEGEVSADNFAKVVVVLTVLDGTVRVDPDGEGIGESNGVRDLDADSVAEAGSDERLGDEASVVGSRAIDLSGVLAGVGTSTMGAPTTVGVDNNLSSGNTSVSSGTSDIELAGGVDDVLSSFLEELSRADLLDDLLDQSLSDFSIIDGGVVLGGDEDVENLDRLEVLSLCSLLVLNNDLRFAVGSEPSDLATMSLSSHLHVDSAGELMRERVESLLIVLVGSVAEHNSLISSADVLELLGADDRVSDVSILSFDDGDKSQFVSVHSLFPGVEADVVNSLTSNCLEVNFSFLD